MYEFMKATASQGFVDSKVSVSLWGNNCSIYIFLNNYLNDIFNFFFSYSTHKSYKRLNFLLYNKIKEENNMTKLSALEAAKKIKKCD